MKKLSEIAASHLNQIEWEHIKQAYLLDRIHEIQKLRFQKKFQNHPAYKESLFMINNKDKRELTRSVLLNKIKKIYEQGFFQARFKLPNISVKYEKEFKERLLHDDRKEVYPIFTSENSKNYTIYYLRTPHRFSYNPDGTIRIIIVNDEIIDIADV